MEIKTQLEAVKAGLEGRSGGGGRKNGKGEGRMIGQVNEMWGMVEELRRRRKVREGGREGWLGDEKALAEVAQVSQTLRMALPRLLMRWWEQILATQQQALQKLTGLTNDVGFDVEVMRQDLGLVTHRRD
jgi:nuclear pore complex protein Nup54